MFRICVIALLFVAASRARDRVPVLVELFTSEGCSSCPPADSLLAQLESKQPVDNADLLVLSEHVDYWNRLGWKDPFSLAVFSERQQDYAERLRSDDVYTPQVVVDGRYATVGSNRANVLRAIESSSESPKPELAIAVSREGNTLRVGVPNPTKGEVWVAVTEARRVSRVEHGENGGRTLQHVAVVRSLRKLTSGETRIQIEKNWSADLRVVAFVQDARSGRILQAAQKTI
jgi:hypothetical protein